MFIVKSKAVENEAKKQKDGFPSMLLGSLGASLLGNLSEGQGIKDEIPELGVLRGSKRAIAAIQERDKIRVDIPSNHTNKNL